MVNFFLLKESKLNLLEYGLMAMEMGKSLFASEVFNCQAPDSGNMEILHEFGTIEQQTRYLTPLLDGSMKSCFGMTEPNVASSNPTNLTTTLDYDPKSNSY
mmetsp:Transcript_3564/g.7199  ORF Transcript_3564/g.7199 Transcript_3564/m.7199 type:complete len:101 (+) Transcript_3564:1311-1613(+)